jgi:hypothetical protein
MKKLTKPLRIIRETKENFLFSFLFGAEGEKKYDDDHGVENNVTQWQSFCEGKARFF